MSRLGPSGKKLEPVQCLSCQHEFRQDPCYEVECPECHAKPGQYCIRPSGHQGRFNTFHAARDLKALELGFYDHDSMTEKCGPHSTSLRAKELMLGLQGIKPPPRGDLSKNLPLPTRNF